MSDETPTERFETPGATEAVSASDGPTAGTGSRQRMLTIILGVIGVVLLIVIAVLVTILIMGGQRQTETPMPAPDVSPSASPSEEAGEPPAPSASTEPEDTPSAAPSASAPPPPPPPPPAATGPVFTTFSPANNTSVGCTSSSGAVPVTFTWTSTGANEAAIGVSTSDAFAGPYETGLPPSGSYTLDYQCSNDSQLYTVSIRGSSGVTHKTVTLKR